MERDVVPQHVSFEPLLGRLQDYRAFVLLAPYPDNHGSGNTACTR